MNMKTKLALLGICAAATLCVSCSTSPVCVTPSITPLNRKMVTENLGKTSGEDNAYSVLGLWMIGHPDVDSAIDEAVKQKGADTLINVRCYESTSYFLFFSRTTVRVEGEAVKITDEPGPKEPVGKGRTK